MSEEAQVSVAVINARLIALKRDCQRMRFWLMGSIALSVVAVGFGVIRSQARPPSSDGVLHVRGLIVEDAHGVERVRLEAPLPDPMGVDGIRHPRSGIISGLLISDAKGTERGGYVTADASDEAFFTLDSRKGQEVLFLANPDGGTNLDLFDKLGNEAQLTVFPEGPKLVMKKAKQVVAQIPAMGVNTPR